MADDEDEDGYETKGKDELVWFWYGNMCLSPFGLHCLHGHNRMAHTQH
jgi:hypothetical protein